MKGHEEEFSEFLTEYRKDGFQHQSYGEIIEALKTGDVETIEQMDWEIYGKQGIGRMSDDPLTQVRYLVVVTSTLGGVYAMGAGVETEVALSLPDYYIRLAQQINDIQTLTLLNKKILIHFCKLIHRQKSIPYSKKIRQAVEFIYNNIYSTIYVQDIAEAMGVKQKYLSAKFKEETGINIKDYIHLEKLKEAKNLMQYTNMSYTEVAVHLGYSDLSHFTKICRKYAGCNPKQLLECWEVN